MEVFTPSCDNFNQKFQHVLKDLWLDTDLSDVSLVSDQWSLKTMHNIARLLCIFYGCELNYSIFVNT